MQDHFRNVTMFANFTTTFRKTTEGYRQENPEFKHNDDEA